MSEVFGIDPDLLGDPELEGSSVDINTEEEPVYNIIYSQEAEGQYNPFVDPSRMEVQQVTADELREMWDNSTHTQDVFGTFENYLAYTAEASDYLADTNWWDAEGVDTRTQTDIIREGDDLAVSPGQQDPNQLVQTDVNARQSGYQQWLMSEENQALMSKYGVDPIITNDKGDKFTWTGSGYIRTYEADEFDFKDFLKIAIQSGTVGLVGGFALGPLSSAIQASTGLGAAASNALSASMISVASQLATTGEVDLAQLVSAAAIAGLAPGDFIAEFTGAVPGDVIYETLKTGINTAVSQGITGNLDLEGILISAGIAGGVAAISDIWADARQSGAAAYENTRASTSDIGGLLGPDGFLAELGLEIAELPTGWLTGAQDFLLGDMTNALYLPDGSVVQANEKGDFELPDGTTISGEYLENNSGVYQGADGRYILGPYQSAGLLSQERLDPDLSLGYDPFFEQDMLPTRGSHYEPENYQGLYRPTDEDMEEFYQIQSILENDPTNESALAQLEEFSNTFDVGSYVSNADLETQRQIAFQAWQEGQSFREYIERGGRLDERYFQTFMERDPDSTMTGILDEALDAAIANSMSQSSSSSEQQNQQDQQGQQQDQQGQQQDQQGQQQDQQGQQQISTGGNNYISSDGNWVLNEQTSSFIDEYDLSLPPPSGTDTTVLLQILEAAMQASDETERDVLLSEYETYLQGLQNQGNYEEETASGDDSANDDINLSDRGNDDIVLSTGGDDDLVLSTGGDDNLSLDTGPDEPEVLPDTDKENELPTSGGGGMLGGSDELKGTSSPFSGKFNPFYSGISYQVPPIQALIQDPSTDYTASLNDLINRNSGMFG